MVEKKAETNKAAAKKAAPKKKLYLVVSAVEMTMDEYESTDDLLKAVEEKARLMGIPLSEVSGSGLIRAFAGSEVQLEVEAPKLKASLGG